MNLKIKFASWTFALLIAGMCNLNQLQAQNSPKLSNAIFQFLPTNLPNPKVPQRYHITTDYINHTLKGDFIDKLRVSGDFTIDSPAGNEKWNNVHVAKSQKLDGLFPEGEFQSYMENFTYQPSADILKPEFFKNFPLEALQVRNLVWDMAGIEGFAWPHLDSLKLNQLYEAKNMNGEVELAGLGSFTNNNIQLIWKGVSMMNGKLCGLIDFRVMDNPLKVNMKMGDADFMMTGRSHYWGTIYISLSEKSLEYVELLEDVVMEIKMSNQPAPNYFYTTRFMDVKKIE